MTGGKRFNTIYLHVGLGKTGTTSIQRELLRYAGALESRHDLHYPRRFPHLHDFEGNHSFLLRGLFFEREEVRRQLAIRGLDDAGKLALFRQRTLDALDKGFAASA